MPINLELDLANRLIGRRARDARADLGRVTSAAAGAGHGVCREVMNSGGTMARTADLEVAALRRGLPLAGMQDLKDWL
jgi:3,4-dihydroxy 2-butanone 4-phosphate synthase/3,4-dihydroxy 2-butanone 4-phosphate synthase/GTP cyclohydrolase II